MMPTSRGRSEVKAYMADARAALPRVLSGGARAGATVIADEIKLRTPSDEVRTKLRMRVRQVGDAVVAKIDLPPGWARSVGIWLEYGTSPHYITVDDAQRDGKSVQRINSLSKAGTLVIDGEPVGSTVFHPGARPHPTFRPALDMKQAEAVAEAQRFINARTSRAGFAVSSEEAE
jgi:hypothetical protein